MALDNVSLEVHDRQFVALLGPSGCGKSTLLYLVGGFLPVEAGRITVGNICRGVASSSGGSSGSPAAPDAARRQRNGAS